MLNFCLYKPCAMCLSLLHFHTCFVSEPNCNCCLSNKYAYMQRLRPLGHATLRNTKALSNCIVENIQSRSDARTRHWKYRDPWDVICRLVQRIDACVGRESNPGQLLGRQLCSPLYHQRYTYDKKVPAVQIGPLN